MERQHPLFQPPEMEGVGVDSETACEDTHRSEGSNSYLSSVRLQDGGSARD